MDYKTINIRPELAVRAEELRKLLPGGQKLNGFIGQMIEDMLSLLESPPEERCQTRLMLALDAAKAVKPRKIPLPPPDPMGPEMLNDQATRRRENIQRPTSNAER